MTLDNFGIIFQPLVEKLIVDHLTLGDWVRRKEKVLLFGQAWRGKTD